MVQLRLCFPLPSLAIVIIPTRFILHFFLQKFQLMQLEDLRPVFQYRHFLTGQILLQANLLDLGKNVWTRRTALKNWPLLLLKPMSIDHNSKALFRTRQDSGSGSTSRLQRTGSSSGMVRESSSSMSRTTSSRFGSSSALRAAVENTRAWQQ